MAGGMSMIGPAMSLASAAGGGKGSSAGGGITPQQAAMMAYSAEQQQLAGQSTFGAHGLGHSTMETMSQAGPQFGEALAASQLADANQAQADAGSGYGAGFGTPLGTNFSNQAGNTFSNQGTPS